MLVLLLAAGVVAGAGNSTRAAPAAMRDGAASAPSAAAVVLAGSWKMLPAAPVGTLAGPDFVVSAWTGREMIIHEALLGSASARGVTFAYRPAANTWIRLPPGPKPILAQGGDVAVWTGSQMLVIGLTSAAYNPATNIWRPIPRFQPPSKLAVWTGHEAVVWQGTCCGGQSNGGAAYNPVTNTWRKIRTSPLVPRVDAMGAWTGKMLVVAGGFSRGGQFFRGAAAYNPVTNTWRRLPPMPLPRAGGTALWDGTEVLVLGGTGAVGAQPALSGMAYNPAANRWRLLPPMAFRRQGFAAVWTGRQVLVWGGLSGHPGAWVRPPHGEAYDPATNRWTALPASPLQGRMVATAAWTGRKMIAWGGYIPGTRTFLDGAAFTPRTPAQRRQLAVTTLSSFKVVLTATRVSSLNATVTAAGYRHTSRGWALIATRQIGRTAAWSWFATDICNLQVTQLKPAPSSATPSDSITVNLLWGPAIGCLGPFTAHWQP